MNKKAKKPCFKPESRPQRPYLICRDAAILFCIVLSLFPASLIAVEKAGDPIVDTRVALEKWVETQRIISQEKRDLALAKEMLNERIVLLNREVESMQQKIADAKKSIAEADKKRAEMVDENEKLKAVSTALDTKACTLEDGLRHLLRQLPDSIRERVKPLSQRLPEDVNTTKLSAPERFQNIVGILNEIDKFNRDISVTSEVRTLPDGSSIEVATLYLGIGQAYYASADGKIAGIGTVSSNGWVWKPDNAAAAQIAHVIAIFKNEKVASFVPVPIDLK